MNISEVKVLVEGASYEEKIGVLERICSYAGDCQENGYLGSSVANICYDEFGRVEFNSERQMNDIIVKSWGTVLDNSVIIMQIQERDDGDVVYLYSWRCDGTSYTSLTFDSKVALEKAYNGIKRLNKGFLAENLDDDLRELGLSYRDIMNVKVSVKVQAQDKTENVLESNIGTEMLTSFVS